MKVSRIIGVVLCLALMGSCGFRKKKYENPITKDTKQPDKILFDKAVKDLERNRFEVARLTLQTLINTYDSSEFLAKAKLAIADSWFREGGSNGLAQAEAEYKDFILFYPTLEEAAEAQERVCMIHYRQMEKPDRDVNHALRADEECRNLLGQFPNSKFAPRVQQLLRNIQEVLAQGEFRVGDYYHHKGSNAAASNRLQGLVDAYPLFSQSDEALWMLGDAYSKMGPRFRDKTGTAYSRIVKDYPLSALAEDAKKKLKEMELEVPEPDPVALARMKYEQENASKRGMMGKSFDIFRKSPDTHNAAKSGNPNMARPMPGIPATVPAPAAAAGAGVTDVTATTNVGPNSALDNQPDARANPPAAKKEGEPATEEKKGGLSDDQNAKVQQQNDLNKQKQKKGKKSKQK
ncbi:MAG: outer membrane protein assembly factor BamD [Acidobacteria bacterium]|nr:outer membrane protein assembly factor BamD [Acidobacteriota bacterium]